MGQGYVAPLGAGASIALPWCLPIVRHLKTANRRRLRLLLQARLHLRLGAWLPKTALRPKSDDGTNG